MRIIKHLGISVFICLFSNITYAVGEGPFLGVEIGNSSLNPKPASGAVITQAGKNNTLGGGATLGANLGQYAALELDLIFYGSVNNQATDLCDSSTTHAESLNVLGKGMYPIGRSGVDVFAKGGLSMLRTQGAAVFDPKKGKCGSKTNTSPFPMAAVGGSYDLSQNVVVEVFYSRIFVNNNIISDINFWGAGLTYHFTDTFCGQFLC